MRRAAEEVVEQGMRSTTCFESRNLSHPFIVEHSMSDEHHECMSIPEPFNSYAVFSV